MPEKELRFARIRVKDIGLAAASGGLTALAFPKFSMLFLGWVSLLPLLFILNHKRPRQAFLLGLVAGLTFNGILVYWIPHVPAHYGDLSIALSLMIYFLMILYLALYWAFFAWVFVRLRRVFPNLALLVAPVLWVSLEFILTHLFTGFPWGLLGQSQHQNLPLIQLSALTGVYGISFVLVLFQSLFVLSMTSRRKAGFLAGLIGVTFIHFGGWAAMKKSPPSPQAFTASAIQGNVSSDIYWDQVTTKEIRRLFTRHMSLTQQAFAQGAQLIVWPEFSVPLCFSCSHGLYEEFKQALLDFVQQTGCTLLVGTNETVSGQQGTLYYNTAMSIQPDLNTSEYYKMHLVPFGEYTPCKKIFSFIEKVTHAIGEITPGRQHQLHRFQDWAFGSPICYEVIFPDLVRTFVRKGADFLVTITNDGWYGKSSAPYQHFAIAVFRAVENRRYLIRAATTGISGIVDPFGRVLARSPLQTQAVLTEKIVPLGSETVYTRYGDWFCWMCLTFSLVFLILAFGKKR